MGAGERPKLGIIGGSGVYDIDGLAETRWQRVESPWGEASDELAGRFSALGLGALLVDAQEPV